MSRSVSDQLAEFRAAKAAKEAQKHRRDVLMDTLSLGPVRRRLAEHLTPNQSEQQGHTNHLEPEEQAPWTWIDYVIVLVQFLLWCCAFALFVHLEFGAVYFVTSCFGFIWLNLGRRKRGEASAYSVFNPNCENITGTFTAEQFDKQLRKGM